MDYMNYIKPGIVAAVILIVLDAIWLGLIAGNFYKQECGALIRSPLNWWMCGCTYLLMVVGFLWFVLPQVQMARSVWEAIRSGARFGVVLYGVYECTNYATLVDWSSKIVIVDTIWGGVIYAVASLAVFFLLH